MISFRSAVATLVALVALSTLPSAVSAQDTCVAFPTTGTHICSPYVTYPIMSSQNVTAAEELVTPSGIFIPNCIYYAQLAYQCEKHFPRCVVDAGVATSIPLCKSTCERGRTWVYDGVYCAQTSWDIDAECASPEFLDASPPACTDRVFPRPGAADEAAWKWALVAIVCAVAVGIAASLIVQYCRKRRVSPEITAEDVDRPFQHEARSKQRQEDRAKAAAEARERDVARAERRKQRGQGSDAARPASPAHASTSRAASQSQSQSLAEVQGQQHEQQQMQRQRAEAEGGSVEMTPV